MRRISLLGLDFLHPVLEIVCLEIDPLHAGHEERRFSEEVFHLFERALSSLGKYSPEENRIGEVADLTLSQQQAGEMS